MTILVQLLRTVDILVDELCDTDNARPVLDFLKAAVIGSGVNLIRLHT